MNVTKPAFSKILLQSSSIAVNFVSFTWGAWLQSSIWYECHEALAIINSVGLLLLQSTYIILWHRCIGIYINLIIVIYLFILSRGLSILSRGLSILSRGLFILSRGLFILSRGLSFSKLSIYILPCIILIFSLCYYCYDLSFYINILLFIYLHICATITGIENGKFEFERVSQRIRSK